MKERFKYFLPILVGFLGLFAYQNYNETQVSRDPIWHPFGLNSDVTFESLVENGYTYDNNQCRQLVYAKKEKDTLIAYGIYIDNSLEEEIGGNETDLEMKENPYYPYDFDKTSNRYQSIRYKSYQFKIGDSIDLERIRRFVRYRANTFITLENWNSKHGGKAMVYNRATRLYFECNIYESEDRYGDKSWYFRSFRYMPFFDKESERLENKHFDMF